MENRKKPAGRAVRIILLISTTWLAKGVLSIEPAQITKLSGNDAETH